MNFQKLCKDTGYFCVGASVWLAEKTVDLAVAAGKATAEAAKKMTVKGERIAAQRKAAAEKRRQERIAAQETEAAPADLEASDLTAVLSAT